MTHNQIDYAKHKENVRHNKRSERQTDRSIAESIRHNKKTEQLGQENVDLGYANVGLGYSNLRELYRHNTQTEVLSQNQLDEAKRHNEATEQNQEDSNVAKVASTPWGYVTYQLDKQLSGLGDAIVKATVKGFRNLEHMSANRTRFSATKDYGSTTAKQ